MMMIMMMLVLIAIVSRTVFTLSLTTLKRSPYTSSYRSHNNIIALLSSTTVIPPTATLTSSSDKAEDSVITLSDKARSHLKHLKEKQGSEQLCLRMGVRAGGCSGMSYVMDFISVNDVTSDDHIEEYDGIKCVVDPKSLMFLYGLQLDYSDELIGGGFKFQNPNAESSCGCGKSFGV